MFVRRYGRRKDEDGQEEDRIVGTMRYLVYFHGLIKPVEEHDRGYDDISGTSATTR